MTSWSSASARKARSADNSLLGDSLDTERITARYDQGVLTITIPVAEQSKARKVQVAHNGEPEVIETG